MRFLVLGWSNLCLSLRPMSCDTGFHFPSMGDKLILLLVLFSKFVPIFMSPDCYYVV